MKRLGIFRMLIVIGLITLPIAVEGDTAGRAGARVNPGSTE